MSEKIKNPSMEQIKSYLGKIHWELRNLGASHYAFVNHEGNSTGLILHGGDLSLRKNGLDIAFLVKDLTMQALGMNTISFFIDELEGGGVCLNCYNFDLKEEEIKS